MSMRRVLATVCLSVCCVALSRAQPDSPAPLRVDQANGKPVWRVASGNIKLKTITDHYFLHASGGLDVSKTEIVGDLNVTAPAEGAALTGRQIDNFVANALDEFRLRLVRNKRGVIEVVRGTDSIRLAPTVEFDGLHSFNPGHVVTCNVPLEHANAQAVRSVLQNLVSRIGGAYELGDTRGVSISDRGDRVRELAALAMAADEQAKSGSRFYALPEGIDRLEAADAMARLFGGIAEFSADEKQQGIVAHAARHLHPAIAQAVAEIR
jgi:hypothetical protein